MSRGVPRGSALPEAHHRVGQRRSRLRRRTLAVPVEHEQDLAPRRIEAVGHVRQVEGCSIEAVNQENGRSFRVDTAMRQNEHVPIPGVQQARFGGLVDSGCDQNRSVPQSLECGPGSGL
jgi:hypothetical protein